MPLDRLVEWWNAVYSLPLAFVLVFLTITSAVSLVGGAFGDLGHGHGDADADADVDADLDVDADVDADLDTDVEHDADVHTGDGHAHHGHGHHGHGHHGPLVGTLVLLGAGQAPVMLLLQILLLFWGLIGLCLHSALGVRSPTGLLWSVPLTLVLSVLGTRSFAAVFGRYFKQYESSAVRRNQLVGRTGRVVYPVTLDEGTVSVRDEHGTLHRVRARSRHAALDCGQEIVVLAYDPERNLYDVDDAVAFVDRA